MARHPVWSQAGVTAVPKVVVDSRCDPGHSLCILDGIVLTNRRRQSKY